MGSTTHIVDEDGIVLNHYEYDAWGNLTAQEEAVPNRFKFTGQQLDPVTQQYYLRARFYNPVIARFTQEDTYRGDGLNLYAYCANRPTHYIDPTGHWCGTKQDVFNKLAAERGLNPDKMDYDTKQSLMAEASNIVKEQKKNSYATAQNSTLALPPSPIVIDSYYNMFTNPQTVGQAHHLSQDAAFGSIIPRNEGLCVDLVGNAFTDVGTPHFEAHKSMEQFWNQYRKNGDLFGERPTVGEYNSALFKSLQSGGFSDANARHAVLRAYSQQKLYGFSNNDLVPRIPGRLNQRKG